MQVRGRLLCVPLKTSHKLLQQALLKLYYPACCRRSALLAWGHENPRGK